MTIPFSMNKTVSVNSVADFSLRIKTTTSDILYGIVRNGNWNLAEGSLSVTFALPETIKKKLIVGSFYKVQLAYIDANDIIGYYSTVGIIKYTAKPSVEINNFLISSSNMNPQEYIGIYRSEKDPTEKVYQYKFDLFNSNDNLLETSGWKLHNSYEDTELDQTSDSYILKYALVENLTYKIRYSVITNNGLELHSPKYLVMEATSVDPELKAELKATLDYDNACINLALIGKKGPNGEEYAATGAFLLSRASSVDNFSTWLPVEQFRLTGDLPSNFLFRDYTIEQGATYRYCIQQFNDSGIYSNRILAPDVLAGFEDAFLFDGYRQLRIRFNPKVTSFKTVLLETKKNTIGNKYPFIFRNGAVSYKEFPISGLISFMMDNDEFFITRKELGFPKYKDCFDITDDNLTIERRFKLEVLNWLNDGNVKLFKSPQEGNYLVRLMNSSLTPNDSVSRMIHTFSTTASEVAAFTEQNLSTYDLLHLGSIDERQMRWSTIILQDLLNEMGYDKLYNYDLLQNYRAYHLKFTDFALGTMFSFVNGAGETQEIMIGATGQYEVIVDQPIYDLKILRTNNTLTSNVGAKQGILPGSITVGIMSTAQNRFDTVNGVRIRDIAVHMVFGPSKNLLEDLQDTKQKVSRIYAARFTKIGVEPIYDSAFGIGGNTMSQVALSTEKYYAITTINDSGDIVNTYYRYIKPGQLKEMPHYETIDRPVVVLSEYKYYIESIDGKTNVYLLRNGALEPYTGVISELQQYTKYAGLSPYLIYDKIEKLANGNIIHTYYKYADGEIKKLDESYSAKVQYGNVDIDLEEIGEIEIEELTDVPEKISIGSGVYAELTLQLKILTYSVEDEVCWQEKQHYLTMLEQYSMLALGMKIVADRNSINVDNPDRPYYLWQNDAFLLINKSELKEVVTQMQDTPIYESCSMSEVYDESQVAQYKGYLDEAHKTFMTALDAALAEKEKELPV